MIVASFRCAEVLLAVAAFALLMAGAGSAVLRRARVAIASPAEYFLTALGLGVALYEVGCFFFCAYGAIRFGVGCLLTAAAALTLAEFSTLRAALSHFWAHRRSSSSAERFARWAFLAVVLLQGIAATAPLSGSDALHYHFTAQRLVLESGFQPYFFLTNSLLAGQGHFLVLTGLALGSDQFAMGLLWLGGVMTALAAATLARHWLPPAWAWLVALTFLLTPVVFWQSTTAGSPDLWIAFFATLGVLAVERCTSEANTASLALAGAFAGAAAGGKYTGCALLLALAVALFEQRKSWRAFLPFSIAAASIGIWPYARNFFWTGDPFFPLFIARLAPSRVNSFALASFLADTRVANPRTILDALPAPFFAALDPVHPGFRQFIGPLCLGLAPLIFFAYQKTSLWRTVLLVWLFTAALLGLVSGVLRFALPVYPLALAAIFAGLHSIPATGWNTLRRFASVTLAGFLLLSTAGLLFYERRALQVALGLNQRATYLAEVAPDFAKARFINQSLLPREREGKALVFFRHLYYLKVPFIYGDPSASWAVDPLRLHDAAAWQDWFHSQGIHWVVKSPEYPAAIREPLLQLERQGFLVPIAESQVEDFTADRLLGPRASVPIVILEYRAESVLSRAHRLPLPLRSFASYAPLR